VLVSLVQGAAGSGGVEEIPGEIRAGCLSEQAFAITLLSFRSGHPASVSHPLLRVKPTTEPLDPRAGGSPAHEPQRMPHKPHKAQGDKIVERDKALDMALGQIEKQFGKGSVMKMGEKSSMAIGTIPTGALSLDLALGVGGLPRGRVVEIYGPESSGKSTLAMHVVAEAQRNGGICAYVDAEHAMDPIYARAIGVDVDELLISQPDTGEQALEITDMLVRSGALDIVVIDSVAALTPRAEIEGDMGDTHVGLQARLMSQALRKLTANLNRTDTICIFINQLREKIGVMFGSPETTPGGRALKFYSSVRLDIRRIESIKDGAEVVGNRTRVKVVKNKVAPPFRQAEFDIMYGKGISREGSLLDIGVDLGIVKKSGAWYTYEGEQLGQGRENAKQFLIENTEIMVEISERVRLEAGLGDQPPEAEDAMSELDDEPISLED
jgi:recombination protein RecA